MTKLIPALGLAAVAGLLAGGAAAATSEDCAICHEDLVAAFALTPHALDRPDAPGCESCHGDGTQHMDEGGDPSLIRYPKGAEGAAMCLGCHAGTSHAFNRGAVHARAEVHCFSCHRIHPDDTPAPAMLRSSEATPLVQAAASTDLCVTCHQRQARAFSRPYGHELGRAGVECVSCHNPHGGPGERSLKVDRSGETVCVTCHSDLEGPFVFPHVIGQVGGCLTCHEPHGSSNPNALKRARVDQLCLECHSTIGGGTLGSQPPAFHDLYNPRFRNCTVCHVAVHGSNTSPGLLK
jgi:DmsE family decaheme c-type cytochrome